MAISLPFFLFILDADNEYLYIYINYMNMHEYLLTMLYKCLTLNFEVNQSIWSCYFKYKNTYITDDRVNIIGNNWKSDRYQRETIIF